MIANSFPRTQGTLSRETYLTLLLLGIVEQVGGEVRLFPESFENLESGGRLLVDWDTVAQQLSIRAGSPSLIVAEVKGSGWVNPQSPQPQPPQPSATHRVMTEDQLIDRLAQRVRKDNLRQWREQGAEVVAGMPPPDET